MQIKNGDGQSRAFLRLIANDDADRKDPTIEPGVQLGLFPERDPAVLSFYHVAYFRSASFLKTVARIRPEVFVDLRAVPSFRSIGLDRKRVLLFLDSERVDYVDASGMIGSMEFSTLQPQELAEFIVMYLKSRTRVRGPIILLMDNLKSLKAMADDLPARLAQQLGPSCRAQVFLGDSAAR